MKKKKKKEKKKRSDLLPMIRSFFLLGSPCYINSASRKLNRRINLFSPTHSLPSSK